MSKEERHEHVTRQKWANHTVEGLQEPLVMSKVRIWLVHLSLSPRFLLHTNDHCSQARRIIPSFIVCTIVLSLCYLYATTYQPPQPSSRLFPDTPPAASTIFTIIGLNLLVYGLWNFFPPAIRLLNKYFISIPGAPNALSVVGNVFSHQSLYHLCSNMFFLWLIGTRIHDPIGRGAFLAIYMGSGVLGSFTSISMLVLRNHLNASSLGASGAVSGVIACFFALHANEKLVVWFLPTNWQEWTSLTGLTWFIGCVGLEIFALVTKGIAKTRIDHYGHLGGYLGGWIGGLLLTKYNMVGNAGLKSVKDRTDRGRILIANHERTGERPGSRK
jgi:rhomboid-like protein